MVETLEGEEGLGIFGQRLSAQPLQKTFAASRSALKIKFYLVVLDKLSPVVL